MNSSIPFSESAPMKLYSRPYSPYSARPRMAIYAKGLPVEVLPPPGGHTHSPEYLAINPIGKVPALAVGDGTVVPESETILEFLADAFPASGLRPARPADAARSRLIARIVDVYLMPAGMALMGQMDPRTRDAAAVEAAFSKMEEGFGYLTAFLTGEGYAVGDSVTTADCALVSCLFFLDLFGQTFGKGDLLARHAKVAAYWARIQRDAAAQKVLSELRDGVRQHFGG